MDDWIVNALEQLQQHLDSTSLGEALVFFLAALVLTPLSTLVHELGHALAARHYGAAVKELVAAGEGPAATATVSGIRVRLGLGLDRDLRSKAAAGWVRADMSRMTPRQAITMLLAGPVAQALFGIVLISAALLGTLPVDLTALLALIGFGSVASAILNIALDGGGRSDGAQIRSIRAGEFSTSSPPEPADATAATASMPPPTRGPS